MGGNQTDPSNRTPAPLTEATMALFVRDLADAVVIADADGQIAFWNDAATRMFGWVSHEAIGESLDLIIPARFRARHWAGYQQVMAIGRSRYGVDLLHVPALHRDGRQLSIAFTVTLLPAEQGMVGWIAALLRDETERRAEIQSLRAELAAVHDHGS